MIHSYEEVCMLQARLRKLADDLDSLKEFLKGDKKSEFHQDNKELNNLFKDLAGLNNDKDNNRG